MSEDQLPNILRYVSPIDARTVAQVARQLVVEKWDGGRPCVTAANLTSLAESLAWNA